MKRILRISIEYDHAQKQAINDIVAQVQNPNWIYKVNDVEKHSFARMFG